MAGDEVSGRGLVLPDATDEPASALSASYSRYLADCCRTFLTIGAELPGHLRNAHGQVATLVRRALEGEGRRSLLTCFAAPSVSTALRCAALRGELEAYSGRIDTASELMLPHLLFEMSLRGLIPRGESMLWVHGAPRLACVPLGCELVPPVSATGLRFSASHLAAVCGDEELGRVATDPGLLLDSLQGSGFDVERSFHRVADVTHLATVDGNPIAAFEEHPDKAGNHIDFGGRPATEWIETLERSFALVARYLPGEFREMQLMLQQAVPVGYDDHKHLSASYREAVGTIYLTLHPGAMTMTEAVIHEFQHNKFNAAAYSINFLENAFWPLYKSPIRPDPRPLWGIVLAVHAFLPVADLYRRMRADDHELSRDPGFERRLSDIDLKNHEGMEMLRAHAEFTPAGRAFMGELEALENGHLADRTARGLDNNPTEIHLA